MEYIGEISVKMGNWRFDIYDVTLWIASARRLTLPVVIPATDILPSLVAYTECYDDLAWLS